MGIFRNKQVDLKDLAYPEIMVSNFKKELHQSLYSLKYEKPEKIETLYVEQDPHTSCDEYSCYKIFNRHSISSQNLPMPLFSLELMKHLLTEYTVFTDVIDKPIKDNIIDEFAKYHVCPHLFGVSYARYATANYNEKIFHNGKFGIITITKGANMRLLNSLLATPGVGITIHYVQSAFQDVSASDILNSYENVRNFSDSSPDMWLNYSNLESCVHIGIRENKMSESELLEMLNIFSIQTKTTIECIWPR